MHGLKFNANIESLFNLLLSVSVPTTLSPVNTQWSNVNQACDVRKVPGHVNIF